MRTLSIAIVGYGIAGITAAIKFRALDHDVTHFERSDTTGAHGAGMLLHPPAQRELQRLGVLDEAKAVGAPVENIQAQTVAGDSIMAISYSDFANGRCALGIQRSALHRVLSECDDGRSSVLIRQEISALDTLRGYLYDKSEVRFGPFDLIVIADGVHSNLRQSLQGSGNAGRVSASAALVGLLPCSDAFSPKSLRQYFDGAQHLSLWPVGSRLRNAERKYSFAINIPRKEAEEFRDNGTWQESAVKLYPALREPIEHGVCNANLHVFTYRDIELPLWAHGRAILIGDAAHSMSPLLGLGAQFAIEDAGMLAKFIANYSDPVVANRLFAEARARQLQPYQRASRWLTPLFQSESRTLAAVRDKLLSRSLNNPLFRKLASEVLA